MLLVQRVHRDFQLYIIWLISFILLIHVLDIIPRARFELPDPDPPFVRFFADFLSSTVSCAAGVAGTDVVAVAAGVPGADTLGVEVPESPPLGRCCIFQRFVTDRFIELAS